MNNILIATDLTANSAAALSRAIQLAHVSGAKLHILHRVTFIGFRKEEKEALQKKTEENIRQLVSKNEYSKHIDISIHLAGRGRLYEIINEYAKTVWADLVVMGLTNKEAPSFISSTVERVIHTGHYPVLMVAKPVTGLYQSMLVYMDMAALPDKIVRLASQFGSEISTNLIPAFNNPVSGNKGSQGFFAKLKTNWRKRKLERFLQNGKNIFEAKNLPSERLLYRNLEDTSSNTLLAEAKKSDTHLVAIDLHRYTGPLHSRVEGFAGKLLEFAPCDILVTKRI